MQINKRVAVAMLSVSLGAFGTWKASEGFTDHAVIPTQGDVPTIGHGSTHYEDGSPVKMGDVMTRPRAEQLARNLARKDENALRASLPAGTRLYQAEYDVYVDFIGQYGSGNWRGSGMRRNIIAGDYAAACGSLRNYRFAAGYDCSTPGNKRCWGVWTRQLQRYNTCMGAQN